MLQQLLLLSFIIETKMSDWRFFCPVGLLYKVGKLVNKPVYRNPSHIGCHCHKIGTPLLRFTWSYILNWDLKLCSQCLCRLLFQYSLLFGRSFCCKLSLFTYIISTAKPVKQSYWPQAQYQVNMCWDLYTDLFTWLVTPKDSFVSTSVGSSHFVLQCWICPQMYMILHFLSKVFEWIEKESLFFSPVE